MTVDTDNGIGDFQLTARDGVSHLNFSTYMENNLWYHYLDNPSMQPIQRINRTK